MSKREPLKSKNSKGDHKKGKKDVYKSKKSKGGSWNISKNKVITKEIIKSVKKDA